jgi:hypothetical protein
MGLMYAVYDACGYRMSSVDHIDDMTKFCSGSCKAALGKAETTCSADPTYKDGFATLQAGQIAYQSQKCVSNSGSVFSSASALGLSVFGIMIGLVHVWA